MKFESVPPLSLLLGRQLTEVIQRDFDWVFLFGDGVSVVTEASHWRLVDSNRVIMTDEDQGQRFGLPEDVDASKVLSVELGGAAITKVECSPLTDLLLSFANGRILQVNVSSRGYENWHVYGPDGSHAYAVGGTLR